MGVVSEAQDKSCIWKSFKLCAAEEDLQRISFGIFKTFKIYVIHKENFPMQKDLAFLSKTCYSVQVLWEQCHVQQKGFQGLPNQIRLI